MEALETSAAKGECLGQSNHYIIIMAVFERRVVNKTECGGREREWELSLIHISEPTRR